MTGREVYWLAGLLEGEGSFGLHMDNRFGRSYNPVMDLGMTDRDVIERAQALVGGNIYTMASRGRRPLFRLRLTGAKAIAVMFTVFALMGERRRERIRYVVQRWKEKPNRRGYRPVGRPI